MNTMLEKTEAYFRENSKKEILEKWREYEKFDKIGPKVDDLISHLEMYFKIPVTENTETRIKSSNLTTQKTRKDSGFFLHLIYEKSSIFLSQLSF